MRGPLEKLKQVVILLFYLSCVYNTAFGCTATKKNCTCLFDKKFIEYQCQTDKSEIILKIEPNKFLEIKCFDSTYYNLKPLPDITISNMNEIQVKNCNNPNFSEIINKFELTNEDIKTIKFNAANFLDFSLTKTLFKDINNLIEIDMQNVMVSDDEEDLLINTPHLQMLSLCNNTIVNLPFIFNFTPELIYLDLSSNKLSNLPEKVFSNLKRLYELNLHKNTLKILTKDNFEGLGQLSILDLSFNKLTILEMDIFSKLVKLETIILSFNRIQQISDKLFHNNHVLSSIYISDNPNLNIPERLFGNMKNLRILYLHQCNLSRIPENVFERSFNLEELSLANNSLQELPKHLIFDLKELKIIYLSYMNLKMLPKHWLKNNQRLTELYLDFNKLKMIENDTFEKLSNLEQLNLKHNEISDISDEAFLSLNKLMNVSLSFNKLSSVPQFVNNKFLKTIDLSYNFIREIPENWVRTIRSIRWISLENNRIHTLEISSLLLFRLQKKVVHIDLSRNNFELIDFKMALNRNHSHVNQFHHYGAITKITLNHSTIQCNCYINDLVKFNNKEIDPSMTQRLEIEQDNLICANFYEKSLVKNVDQTSLPCPFLTGCPEKCFCHWNPDDSIMVNCSEKNLDAVPKLMPKNFRSIYHETFYFNQFIVDLSRNQITKWPGKQSGYEEITSLILSHNKLDNINWIPPKIKVLHLDHNEITNLTEVVFKNLLSLQILMAQHNKLWFVDPNLFLNLPKLTELNLSHNNLSFVFDNETDACPNLEIVDLSYNCLREFPQHLLRKKTRLSLVNLTHNNLDTLKLSNFKYTESYELEIDFSQNNFTIVDMKELGTSSFVLNQSMTDSHQNNTTIRIILNDSLIKCDCHIYDLVQSNQNKYDLIKTKFNIVQNNLLCSDFDLKQVKNINPLELSCPVLNGCPMECFCEWKPYDQSIVVNCSNKNLINIPKIHTEEFKINNSFPFIQTKVDLSGNALNTGPDEESGYENVTTLILSNNSIHHIDWIPSDIKVLQLDHNQLKTLDKQIITSLKLKSLEVVTLSENPWKCDCDAFELQKFISKFSKIINRNDVVCEDTKKLLVDTELICYDSYFAVNKTPIIISTFVLILILLVILAMYYRYKREIKMYLFSKNMCLWFVTEEDLDKHKTYDVFLCFSHKDEDFIITEILPELEKEPNPYKVCVHVRDWTPGEFISTQVTDSVQESRRTMIILSNNFIESVWCKIEFRAAHTQAIADGMARVIIVVYGELNEELLDDELKAYLKTNTYVKWGDPWFWRKVRYAMPHSVRRQEEEEVMLLN